MFIIGAGRFRLHLQQRGLLMKKLMIIGGIAAAVLVDITEVAVAL